MSRSDIDKATARYLRPIRQTRAEVDARAAWARASRAQNDPEERRRIIAEAMARRGS